MKTRLILAAAALAFCACKKEKSTEDPYKGNTCDYAPYSNGALFSYKTVDGSTDTLEFSLTAVGDSLVNGESWRVLQDVADGSKALFRCGNGDYETYADFSGIPGAPADPIRTAYLRESVSLGGSWTETVVVNVPPLGQVNVTLTHTIMQKGTAKTVFGQRFENVIGVRTEASVPPVIPSETLFTNYFAKGVGLVQSDTPDDTTFITSYNIP